MPGTYIAVNTYFKERLTLAISFQVTGTSLVGIFMPQLCNYFLNKYDVEGTLLILAAISFHAIPAAMLFRPLTKRKIDVEKSTQEQNAEVLAISKPHASWTSHLTPMSLLERSCWKFTARVPEHHASDRNSSQKEYNKIYRENVQFWTLNRQDVFGHCNWHGHFFRFWAQHHPNGVVHFNRTGWLHKEWFGNGHFFTVHYRRNWETFGAVFSLQEWFTTQGHLRWSFDSVVGWKNK